MTYLKAVARLSVPAAGQALPQQPLTATFAALPRLHFTKPPRLGGRHSCAIATAQTLTLELKLSGTHLEDPLPLN